MHTLEFFAIIVSLGILIKMASITFMPKKWQKFIDGFAKKSKKSSKIFQGVFLLLTIIIGYYVTQSINIVQVGAVTLFLGVFIAFTMFSYPKMYASLVKAFPKKDIIRDGCLAMFLWAIFALWILGYILFA